MSAQTRKPARGAAPKLPPVSVAHFEEAMRLVEDLVDEQTDLFIAKGQQYRERHREGTERKLDAGEAAQVASAMADAAGLPPIAVAVAVQESDLRAYDEPEPVEILLRAGIATAPAAMDAVKRFVALIELPAERIKEAREADTLNDVLTDAVDAMAYDDLAAARTRARAAAEHFEAAVTEGKASGLLLKAMWQAIGQATSSLGLQRAPSSLTGSPPSTAGLSDPSSTNSPTSEP